MCPMQGRTFGCAKLALWTLAFSFSDSLSLTIFASPCLKRLSQQRAMMTMTTTSSRNSHHHHQQCCKWDSYKFALYSKFREPKLFRYVAEGEWDQIPNRCQSHPREAQFVHKYAPMDTPLNRLLRTQSSLDGSSAEVNQGILDMKRAAVTALLWANLGAATSLDAFRRTPLHWACMDVKGNHGSLKDSDDESSIILMLLQQAPAAARMMDIEHRTPLHYLIARNDEIPLSLVKELVLNFPEALIMKDEVAETPIDILQSRSDEIENYEDVRLALSKLQSTVAPSIAAALQRLDTINN